jgi:hypothetical protein
VGKAIGVARGATRRPFHIELFAERRDHQCVREALPEPGVVRFVYKPADGRQGFRYGYPAHPPRMSVATGA